MFRQVLAVGHDEAGHACLGHLQGEVVGVEVLAFQSEENGVLFDLATVGGDFVCFFEVLINFLYHIGILFDYETRDCETRDNRKTRSLGSRSLVSIVRITHFIVSFNKRSRLTDQTASMLS